MIEDQIISRIYAKFERYCDIDVIIAHRMLAAWLGENLRSLVKQLWLVIASIKIYEKLSECVGWIH